MKSKLLNLIYGTILISLLFSCSKKAEQEETIEINTEGLTFNSVMNINSQLLQTKVGKEATLPRSVTSNTNVTDIESELIVRPIVTPLIKKGKERKFMQI